MRESRLQPASAAGPSSCSWCTNAGICMRSSALFAETACLRSRAQRTPLLRPRGTGSCQLVCTLRRRGNPGAHELPLGYLPQGLPSGLGLRWLLLAKEHKREQGLTTGEHSLPEGCAQWIWARMSLPTLFLTQLFANPTQPLLSEASH